MSVKFPDLAKLINFVILKTRLPNMAIFLILRCSFQHFIKFLLPGQNQMLKKTTQKDLFETAESKLKSNLLPASARNHLHTSFLYNADNRLQIKFYH